MKGRCALVKMVAIAWAFVPGLAVLGHDVADVDELLGRRDGVHRVRGVVGRDELDHLAAVDPAAVVDGIGPGLAALQGLSAERGVGPGEVSLAAHGHRAAAGRPAEPPLPEDPHAAQARVLATTTTPPARNREYLRRV